MADVILHLADRTSFNQFLEMPVREISSGMESGSLRESRPEPDQRFHRDFDVDLEGEILELFDGSEPLRSDATLVEIASDSAMELGVLLAKWCSSAQWRCWDARLFLYVEPMLGREVSSSEEFLSPETWDQFADALSRTDRSSFSESVVLDWMSRREGMGETMEPSEDPRILPTMESHRSLSESLFWIIDQSRKSDSQLLVGREFLEPGLWSMGGEMISDLLGGSN